jgi:anti-sigma factor RsiW
MDPMTHPADERLAALAGDELEARADAGLIAHVGECVRCSTLVAELRSLQTALADLPDIVPSRPLRLLPPVPEPERARNGVFGTLRRLGGPALAIGALLMVVGAFGSVGPGLLGGAAGAAPALVESASDAARAAASHQPSPSTTGRFSTDFGSPQVPVAAGVSPSPRSSADEQKSVATPSRTVAPEDGAPTDLSGPAANLYPLILLLGTALAVSGALLLIVGRIRAP